MPAALVVTAVTAVAVASADDVSNNLDASIDAVAENMPLSQDGAVGATNLFVNPMNGDGKNGCNLTGGTSLGVSVQSSNTSVATVSPSSITFTSCGATPTVTVTPHSAGTATITVSQVSNTSAGTFDFAPATFTVTVSPPPNTPPQISVDGVTAGASYNKGSVPGATCSVTDAEDGNSTFAATLSSVTGPNSADGIGEQTVSCSYTDAGGLTASASKTYSIVDPSAPTISHVLTPSSPDGENGWWKSDVGLTWSVTEVESPLSLLKTGCVDQSIVSDQTDTSYSCSASSAGGSAGPDTVTIKRDATKPVIARHASADSCDISGENGWCRGTQTVGFSASDATSGLVDGDGNALASPFDFVKTRGEDGKDVSVSSGTIKDAAGNVADAIDAEHLNIDGTKPVITRDSAADTCDTPGHNGWCRGTQTAGFSASDATSGLVDEHGDPVASPDPITQATTDNGSAVQISSGTIEDAAGNQADAVDAGPFMIDSVAPTMPTATTTPASPDYGPWFKDSVTVSYGNSSDATSHVASYSLDQTFTTSGTHSYSGTARDNAGNVSDAISGSVKVDADKPLVAPTCPSGDVVQGSVATATWSATDGESGVAGATSGSIPLDTTTIGAKTATAPAGTAVDNVGHPSDAASCTYNVIYNWSGFYSPVNNAPTWNVVKAGSAVPVKFSLDGTPLPGSNTSGKGPEPSVMPAGYPASQKIDCATTAAQDPIEETVTAGMSTLTYDGLADQWVYVWKTDKAYAGSCRQLIVGLADGTYHQANFKFTK